MKRFLNFYLSMTLIASLFLVVSCGEDPIETVVEAPAVEGPVDGAATIDVGDTLVIPIEIVAPGGFNTIIVNQTALGQTVEIMREGRPAGVTSDEFQIDFQFVATEDLAGEEVILDFVAVDDDNREGSFTYIVNVNEIPVATFPATLLFAPAADGSTETFFSTVTGESFSSDEVTGTAEAVSPLIDFGYFYGQTFGPTLASPADFPVEAGQEGWNVLNDTALKLTDLDLSAFTESDATIINAAFEDAAFGTNEGQVRNLEVGQVIAFETDPASPEGSRRGLIYVDNIQPGFDNDDFIEIIVKVIE